jgi:hypothetical protein
VCVPPRRARGAGYTCVPWLLTTMNALIMVRDYCGFARSCVCGTMLLEVTSTDKNVTRPKTNDETACVSVDADCAR